MRKHLQIAFAQLVPAIALTLAPAVPQFMGPPNPSQVSQSEEDQSDYSSAQLRSFCLPCPEAALDPKSGCAPGSCGVEGQCPEDQKCRVGSTLLIHRETHRISSQIPSITFASACTECPRDTGQDHSNLGCPSFACLSGLCEWPSLASGLRSNGWSIDSDRHCIIGLKYNVSLDTADKHMSISMVTIPDGDGDGDGGSGPLEEVVPLNQGAAKRNRGRHHKWRLDDKPFEGMTRRDLMEDLQSAYPASVHQMSSLAFASQNANLPSSGAAANSVEPDSLMAEMEAVQMTDITSNKKAMQPLQQKMVAEFAKMVMMFLFGNQNDREIMNQFSMIVPYMYTVFQILGPTVNYKMSPAAK